MLVTITICGCATASKKPDLGLLYTKSANYPKPQRNPVIIIPGLLGSKLRDVESGTVAWGAFFGKFADPAMPKGARLAALPMRKGIPLKDLKDSLISDGALDRIDLNILMLPVRLNAYYNILRILGIAGYRDEDLARSGSVKYEKGHFTSFQFDYDWRRDIVENAKLLDEFIKKERRYVQNEIEKRFGIKDYDVKFDIVAHSMGGLIARYYLRYGSADLPEDGSLPITTWAGCKYIEKVVMIGTPNAGSVLALRNLVEGYKKGPFIPAYPAALLGTMPSFYQLLPPLNHGVIVKSDDITGASLDVFDADLWIKLKWGLASPKQARVLKILLPEARTYEERYETAIDHLRKCLARARQFRDALDIPSDPPEGVSFHLFAGDAIPTEAVVAVDMKGGSIEVIEKAPGDGLVLRSSALMDERIGGEWSPRLRSPIKWSTVMFLFTDHLGMTEDPAFSDNVLYYLLEHPAIE